MPSHISAIEVMVSDLKKASKWYQEVLGFKVVERVHAYNCVELALEKDNVVLDLGEPNPEWGAKAMREGQSMIGRITGVTLQTNNIERIYKHLERKGVCIIEPPRKRPWGEIRMRFADLDGNELTIIELLKKPERKVYKNPRSSRSYGR